MLPACERMSKFDPSFWTSCCGGVLDMSDRKETPRVHSVDMLEALHIPSGFGKPQSPPGGTGKVPAERMWSGLPC